MGLVNFYHRFITQCAQILQPLNALQSAIRPPSSIARLNGGDNINEIACATLLKPSAPMCIINDASDIAVGAVLQQLIDDVWCPILYFSKKLKQSETRYSTFDRELLDTSGISSRDVISSSELITDPSHNNAYCARANHSLHGRSTNWIPLCNLPPTSAISKARRMLLLTFCHR